jgi:uncharacterized protein (DUF2461 family)
LFGAIQDSRLTRDPKGFPRDHPASDLIRMKHWAWSSALPVEVARTADLVKEISRRFEALTPLVNLLNEPLSAKPRREIYFE